MFVLYATTQPRRHAQNARNDAIETRTQSEKCKLNFEIKCFGRQRAIERNSWRASSFRVVLFALANLVTRSSPPRSNSLRPVSDHKGVRVAPKSFNIVLRLRGTYRTARLELPFLAGSYTENHFTRFKEEEYGLQCCSYAKLADGEGWGWLEPFQHVKNNEDSNLDLGRGTKPWIETRNEMSKGGRDSVSSHVSRHVRGLTSTFFAFDA